MVESQRKKRRSHHTPSARARPKPQQQQIQPSTIHLDKRDDYFSLLRLVSSNHVDSFNYAVGTGLHIMAQDLEPVEMSFPSAPMSAGVGKTINATLRMHSFSLQKPRYSLSASTPSSLLRPLLPMQCRLSGTSYISDLYATFTLKIGDNPAVEIPSQRVARLPVMVGSTACHLNDKTRDELIQMGEEEFEFGGCFVINGAEKVIRLTIVPRCNHPISAARDANEARGPLFSNLSLSFRSMRRDFSTSTLHFHFLNSGAVRARLQVQRSEYFIPVGVLLRALLPSGTTDRDIYQLIIGGETGNAALCNSAIAIVKELSERYVHFRAKNAEPDVKTTVSRMAAIAYLGKNFRASIGLESPTTSDFEAGTTFLRRSILTHLSVGPYESPDLVLDRSKADIIVFLIRKLVLTSTGDVEVDNADAISHQSIMTPGHLFLILLKDRIETALSLIANYVARGAEKRPNSDYTSSKTVLSAVKEGISKVILRGDFVSKAMQYLLSTGNISPSAKLDLPQAIGYTVIGERINMLRYMSHFRAVHRGKFYASMRSTKIRKLLPEAWGFICPVHTPDGEPCGILNHLASDAIVTTGSAASRSDIVDLFSDFNVTPAPALSALHAASPQGSMPLIVDGRVIGFLYPASAEELANQIRYTKVRGAVENLSQKVEVVLVMPVKEKSGFMPGIFVHTVGGRIMRPVRWLHMAEKSLSDRNAELGMKEWIGSLEQVFLRVRPAFSNSKGSLSPVDAQGATHEELSSTSFLSVLAQLSPFPEMNQGPRNMFQCQMAKQTMGTPCHAIWNRTDSKTYQLATPQVPITRNFCMQDPLGADLFPNGVNAVVAVISYSGNDMEDALILNKASIDRGFARGNVYVNERINLDDTISGRESVFQPIAGDSDPDFAAIDEDGLPAVGAQVEYGTKLYGKVAKHETGPRSARFAEHKLAEKGTIDQVVVYDSDMYRNSRRPRGEGIREANIRTRIPRKPTVGDKFASRAGQKGTMSSAWPSEDMPFAESGMTPDILFNPNGFPSRMTIGMMVEIMSGKCGALHGRFNDSSPFQFDERVRAVDYFAEQLVKAGYQYSGNETMYSGYTGEPIQAEIFTGVVYYQRLRHMVSDKFQVRSTGSVHPLFRQPIKGRKRGGAIRFGEMERDGLLAHGAAFLLLDRLGVASDLHVLHVCEMCGSLLSPIQKKDAYGEISCLNCEFNEQAKGSVKKVALPYSFKYLVNELAAMNIRTVLKLKEVV